MKPARNATGSLAATGTQARRSASARGRRAGRARARAAPAPGRGRATDPAPAPRQPTSGIATASPISGSSQASRLNPSRGGAARTPRRRWRRVHPRSRLRVARSDPDADELLHVLSDARVRLVERGRADRAHDLALELVLGRPLLARDGRRGRASASATVRASSSRSAAGEVHEPGDVLLSSSPTWSSTIRPVDRWRRSSGAAARRSARARGLSRRRRSGR